jgi:sugar phosphate permease
LTNQQSAIINQQVPVGRLRWWIGGLLFLSTVINYIDRQTLSVLGPTLKTEYSWSNADFALVIISFRVAYTLGQAGAGRFLDAVGTRTGLTVTVAFYSIAAMLTSLASGLRSFCFFRFLLGLGEAGNWPGATKAVAEWFPRRESGWAVALFDSGSSIGAAVAPFLVLGLLNTFGTWRPAFLLTGALGFLWLLLFRALYYPPETHPRISEAERNYILADRQSPDESDASGRSSAGYGELLRLPQTWGIVLGKALTDPVWFFITDWFAIYLVSRGFSLERGLLAFWVPFIAADAGNFLGGGFSSYLRQRSRHEHAHGKPAVLQPVCTDSMLRRRDVFVCGAVNDGAESASGHLSTAVGRDRQRSRRRSRRCGNDRGNIPDRCRRRSLFVRADPRRCQPRSAAGRDRPGGAGAQYRHQPAGAGNLRERREGGSEEDSQRRNEVNEDVRRRGLSLRLLRPAVLGSRYIGRR